MGLRRGTPKPQSVGAASWKPPRELIAGGALESRRARRAPIRAMTHERHDERQDERHDEFMMNSADTYECVYKNMNVQNIHNI